MLVNSSSSSIQTFSSISVSCSWNLTYAIHSMMNVSCVATVLAVFVGLTEALGMAHTKLTLIRIFAKCALWWLCVLTIFCTLLPAVLFFVYSSSMVPLAFFTSVFITTVRQAGRQCSANEDWLFGNIQSTCILFLTVNTGMVVFVVGMFVIVIISKSLGISAAYILSLYARMYVVVHVQCMHN